MQSAVDSVLATLDRTHDPLRVPAVVDWSREAGLRAGQPRPDLRDPGGVPRGLERRVEAALGLRARTTCRRTPSSSSRAPRLARRVGRGELPMPDEDDLADKYLHADEQLGRAGLELVRGVQLGARRGEPVPAQRALLDRWPLVGRRAGRPQPRGRRALVERQAPRGVRRSAGRRRQPGRGPRDARRRDPTGRAGAARAPAARRTSGARPRPARTGRGRGAGAAWLVEPPPSGSS